MCASNRATGVPASKEGFAPAAAFTGTAIIFPSAASKNSSLPSPRQRGCWPPAIEMVHSPSPGGNGRTYTSRRPDRSEVKAIQWLSGESWPNKFVELGPQEWDGLPVRRGAFGGENPKITFVLRINLEIDDEPAVPRPLMM